MTSKDKLQLRTFIIGIALITLTALSIYFIYGGYLFNKWPWLKFSVVMSTLTCLWTYTVWFYNVTDVTEGEEDTYDTFIFGVILFVVIVIPCEMIFLYPGLEALRINSDSKMVILMFVLAIVHGLGFFFIQKEIEKYLHDLT